ncbi:nuclear transport factor 2 family protein [Nonomuraea sp. NPDC050663]|uniref:nuclear transport factor 2 family protein n=1 Tax=Nonomuraea sp. NPDC050663 TaxID=3364370 RepID=UPI00379260A7
MNELLARQIAAIEGGDLEGLLRQYHPDAVVTRLDLVARGREEIRALFAAYLAKAPKLEELGGLQEAGDTLLYRATMVVDGQRFTTFGTFVLNDGLIWRQTAVALPA